MPLIAPILDDRSFEDLFTELRHRIPVYNPAWTDHLDSDPGITLLQLFAYLGEGLQFRFNQIPEATQIAFLKLLGIAMTPACAAQALVRFEGKHKCGVCLYAGDQVKAGKTIFTLSQDATIWPLDCVSVARQAELSVQEQADHARVKHYLGKLEPEQRLAVQASIDALELSPGEDIAPYTLARMGSNGTDPALDFSATVDHCVWIGVLISAESGLQRKDLLDPTHGMQHAVGRNISLSLGYSPAPWYPDIDEAPGCATSEPPSLLWQASLANLTPAGQADYIPIRVSADSSAGFTREGVIRLELPPDLEQRGIPPAPPGLAGTGQFPPELEDDQAARLWFWLRAWRGDQSRIGRIQLISLNTLACEQSIAASPELLGTGNGQPGQVYQLAHAPVLLDERHPVRLQVEESGVWTDWSLQDNLDASGREDRHFVIHPEAGTLAFGERFPQLGERVRVLAYRWGGGSAGNLPARSISKVGALIDGPRVPERLQRADSSLKCSNPLAAQGGEDPESLDAALARIPTELRRNRRAVARDDFAELALRSPGVALARAECMALFHAPSRLRRPGCVSVIIWPAQDPQHPNAPRPDARELAQTCNWLDRWRLITTELYVIPPTYRRIALSISVKVSEGYGLDSVRDWLEVLLRQYLAPLPPYGPDGRGWPLGRRVMARELEGVAMQVEGIDYIEALRLDAATVQSDGSERWGATAVLTLSDWEVPEVAGIIVVDHATALPAPGSGLTPPPSKAAVPVPVIREEC